MRKLGLWLIKVVHVLAVVSLAWVGGGMWLGKNSSPSESTLGGWVSAGAIVVAVLGAVLIYGCLTPEGSQTLAPGRLPSTRGAR